MSGDPAAGGGRFGRFEIRLVERQLLVDGAPVTLGSRAFDLLAALVTRRDRVVPKDELMDIVWPGLIVEDNNLQVQISALRKVLGAQTIATLPSRGYQFTVAASAAVAAAVVAAPPAAVPWDRVTTRPRPAAASPTRTARLLVADDNKVNRLLLCRSIELMGHEVASADNGRVALEMLRAERFDLLLLDLEMPELDGFALLELRAADAALMEVPVIVTSSLEGAAQVARCIELGADDFLHKPVNPVLLKARVESSLERKRLRDRQRELLARVAPGLAGDAGGVGGSAARRVEATVLAAKLHGLDRLDASHAASETLELVSSWTTLMVDAIEGCGGRVVQIAGDVLMAVFGAAEPVAREGDAARAASGAAVEMIDLVGLFNAERAGTGKAPVVLGIGIASGAVIAGHAGTPRRAAYVCIGAPVANAARLAERAGERGTAVLLDDATRAALARAAPSS